MCLWLLFALMELCSPLASMVSTAVDQHPSQPRHTPNLECGYTVFSALPWVTAFAPWKCTWKLFKMTWHCLHSTSWLGETLLSMSFVESTYRHIHLLAHTGSGNFCESRMLCPSPDLLHWDCHPSDCAVQYQDPHQGRGARLFSQLLVLLVCWLSGEP